MGYLLKMIIEFYLEKPLWIWIFWLYLSWSAFDGIKSYYEITEKRMSIFKSVFYIIFCILLGPCAYISAFICFRLSKEEIEAYAEKKYISIARYAIKELDDLKDLYSKEWSEEDLETYEKNKEELENKINNLENRHEIKIE